MECSCELPSGAERSMAEGGGDFEGGVTGMVHSSAGTASPV